jgi:hypothetical protein
VITTVIVPRESKSTPVRRILPGVLLALAALACQRSSVVIGDNPNTSGNSFWHGVSKQFDEPELRRLHDELNGPRVRAKLQQYVCPDTLPPYTITVMLWREGKYQERGVRLQMTPPLYKKDGRIENGIGYHFERTVHAIDKGKPIDYGYRSPLDGSPRTPIHTDSYADEPPVGDCHPKR